VQQSHATIDPYVAAGKFHLFDGEKELFPGIRSMPAYGHMPGHTAFMIESRDRRLLLWGDTVHLVEVQFADPTNTIDYDADRQAAFAWRKKILAEAAAQGFLVGGAHISFPGLGHVRADAQGYSWITLPYNAAP
jgi:glyoxylase-like metal-dependent hydrolase (beta-lactamase superfamily II)